MPINHKRLVNILKSVEVSIQVGDYMYMYKKTSIRYCKISPIVCAILITSNTTDSRKHLV